MAALVLSREERFALAGGAARRSVEPPHAVVQGDENGEEDEESEHFRGNTGASCAQHCRKHRAGHARASKKTERDFNTEGAESKAREMEVARVVVLRGLAGAGCGAKAAARPPHSKWRGYEGCACGGDCGDGGCGTFTLLCAAADAAASGEGCGGAGERAQRGDG